MTPAEHARLIEKQEFEAECKAARRRAFVYAKQCRQHERTRFERWLRSSAEEPADLNKRITANREVRKKELAVHFGKKPKLYTYNGKAKSLSEWSNITGVKYQTLLWRIRSGMDIERALTMKHGSRVAHHTINGESKTLQEWADHIGICYSALMRRLKTRTLAEAIAMPAGRHPKHLPGVHHNLEGCLGTGAGSTLQEIPDLTFKDKPE